jgi:hypothetical protein
MVCANSLLEEAPGAGRGRLGVPTRFAGPSLGGETNPVEVFGPVCSLRYGDDLHRVRVERQICVGLREVRNKPYWKCLSCAIARDRLSGYLTIFPF